MATGTNGIATRGDLNGLLPQSTYKFWASGLTKCPTLSDIMNAHYSDSSRNYRLSVKNTYQTNQLVKYSDCGIQYGVTINISNCQSGASFPLNENWSYSEGSYTATSDVFIDVYSGSTVIDTTVMTIQFTATDVSDGVIGSVYGQATYSDLRYFNMGTEITGLRMRLSQYDNVITGISNGSIHSNSSLYPITDSCTVNWQTITFEFT